MIANSENTSLLDADLIHLVLKNIYLSMLRFGLEVSPKYIFDKLFVFGGKLYQTGGERE